MSLVFWFCVGGRRQVLNKWNKEENIYRAPDKCLLFAQISRKRPTCKWRDGKLFMALCFCRCKTEMDSCIKGECGLWDSRQMEKSVHGTHRLCQKDAASFQSNPIHPILTSKCSYPSLALSDLVQNLKFQKDV